MPPNEAAEPLRHGIYVLQNPHWNKLTAFPHEERVALGIEGLLPPSVENIEMQAQRALAQLDQKTTDLERYIYLVQLLDSSETLFYRVVMSDPARILPIIYAPTVGEACLKFGHIFRRPRGMYITIEHKGRVREVLRNWPERDVRFICVTTGGRILGLGDLGANGMGIPIGKLQLYTACAGVPPQRLLPLLLDCGTDNSELLNDPLYLGLRRPRPSAAELDEFVEEFVGAVQDVFPRCCIHFEDWKGEDAIPHACEVSRRGVLLQRRHSRDSERDTGGADERDAHHRRDAKGPARINVRSRRGERRHCRHDCLRDGNGRAFARRGLRKNLDV